MKKRGGPYLSEEERAHVYRLHCKGYSDEQVAQVVGCSVPTVKRWVSRGGDVKTRPKPKPKRPPRQTPEEVEDRVCELRLSGLRGREVAEVVGLHPDTVGRVLKRRGLWVVQEVPSGEAS